MSLFRSSVSFLALCCASAVLAEEYFFHLDPANEFLKDQRESTAAPVLGYAGTMVEYPDEMLQWFFVKDREGTAKMMKEAGAKLVKEWGAVQNWQVSMAYANAKTDEEREAIRKRYHGGHFLGDPAAIFSFRKENGMKVLLCLEQYSVLTNAAAGGKSGDIEVVKMTICDYLKWIVDNGFKDQVAGFELGNEPYWGKDPEEYGRRWCEIVPAMKKIWPDAQIGMPLAEYRPDDPDIAAVRARCEDLSWCEQKGEFSFSRLNQWSGRFIVAMKPVLDDITHVIYHFYGANAAYGCSVSGFKRIDNFSKVYPEVKDKKVWITEWRERADEDNRCHQTFSSALWKAHYLLAVLTRPDIDGVNNHCIASLAGGLYVSDGKTWRVQWDEKCKDYPDVSGVGHPHMELGPSGPLFRLYTDALAEHPIVLTAGAGRHQGLDEELLKKKGQWFYRGTWASAIYYDRGERSVQWVAAADPERSSLTLLCANTKKNEFTYHVHLTNAVAKGTATVLSVSCPAEMEKVHEKAGEPKPWTLETHTVEVDSSADGVFDLVMPPLSYMTFTVPMQVQKTEED